METRNTAAFPQTNEDALARARMIKGQIDSKMQQLRQNDENPEIDLAMNEPDVAVSRSRVGETGNRYEEVLVDEGSVVAYNCTDVYAGNVSGRYVEEGFDVEKKGYSRKEYSNGARSEETLIKADEPGKGNYIYRATIQNANGNFSDSRVYFEVMV